MFINFGRVHISIFLTLLVSSSLFFLACAKEKEQYLQVPDIQLKGTACLGTAAENIKKYFAGKSSIEEASQIWPCYRFALNTFKRYVRGQNRSYYDPKEVREFVESYFLNDPIKIKSGSPHLISDQLLVELMSLKTVFLGGNTQVITKKEFDFVLDFLETIQKETLQMWPHSRLIFDKSNKSPEIESFDAAVAQFEKSLMSLVSYIKPESARYSFASLNSLLTELNLFFSKLNGQDEPAIDWGKFVPTLSRAKGLFLNSDPDYMDYPDWPRLAQILTQGMRSGLFFRYYVNASPFDSQANFSNMNQFINEVLVIFHNAFSFRNGDSIRDEEVEGLLGDLAELDFLPFQMDSATIQKLWRALASKLLNPQNKYGSNNLSFAKFNYLLGEYNSWVKIQNLIFDEKEDLTDPRWMEMKSILDRPYRINLDLKSNIVLDGVKGRATIPTATRLNWERAIFSVLYRTYVRDLKRLQKGTMTQGELNEVYLDLQPVLIGLGLVGDSNDSFYKRIFRDANLFMPSSDGNENLEFHEAIEYLHFILSGIHSGREFVRALEPPCILDQEHVDIECFRRDFRLRSPESLSHLPLFLDYSKTLSSAKWKQNIKNLEIINRSNGDSDSPIERGEIYETFVLLQYLEVIMLNYDVDRSGDFDLVETLKLAYLFRGVLKDILGLDYEKDRDGAEAFFTYMLKTEELPDPLDPLTGLRLFNWRLSREEWSSIRANRGTLLKILAIIKKAS